MDKQYPIDKKTLGVYWMGVVLVGLVGLGLLLGATVGVIGLAQMPLGGAPGMRYRTAVRSAASGVMFTAGLAVAGLVLLGVAASTFGYVVSRSQSRLVVSDTQLVWEQGRRATRISWSDVRMVTEMDTGVSISMGGDSVVIPKDYENFDDFLQELHSHAKA